MTLEEFSQQFLSLAPQEKIKFIYTHIDELAENERVEFLIAVIKDEQCSPLVKATALKFLRQSSYAESELYKKYLGNHFQAVAKAARAAFQEIEGLEKKNRYIAESVLKKIESTRDKSKRIKIVKALVRLKASWVPLVLLEALADPAEAIRDLIINELSQKQFLNLNMVGQRLLRPPWYVKSSVLKILGRRKAAEAINLIASVLEDSNADVRRSAAQALGEIGGKEALALLVKLTKDRSIYVRQAAEEALKRASDLRFS